ncbi:MAG: hypothetical protein KDF58_01835 [Alphaproteobacteria bacterium]|nr:hypothetical protein [Alphaproteobacteria bacterium]HPF47468.1 hypothetical protein [Emcibacteraceae bacterium]
MGFISDQLDKRSFLYGLFKYSIYLLLLSNILLFFRDEWLASSHLFTGNIPLEEILKTFNTTIDTLVWTILLILFEMETWILSDEALKNNLLKNSLLTIRSLCYIAIIMVCYNYVLRLGMFYDISPMDVGDICSLAGQDWSYIDRVNGYSSLTAENCPTFQGKELFALNHYTLFANADTIQKTQQLAWTDVINSSSWLLIVAILEIEVWYQVKQIVFKPLIKTFLFIKTIIYITMLACAIYWGIDGSFLEFWDAMLWILAFVFIELNLFQWQEEILERSRKRRRQKNNRAASASADIPKEQSQL